MGKSSRLPFLVVAGFVVAFLLVWGGVMLGLDPGVRGALGGVLPGRSGAGEACELQEEILDKLDSTYYKAVDEAALRKDAVDGLVAGLKDPYTVYMDPEEYASFQEQTSGSYDGVGMIVEMKSQLVTIVSTFKGSPAAQAGIEPGDIIVQVDGVSTEGQNLNQVVTKIKGDDGSVVRLTVYRPPAPKTTATTVAESQEKTERETSAASQVAAGSAQLPPDGHMKEYTITRKTIDVPVAEATTLTAGSKKVRLISLLTFSDGAARELRKEVDVAVKSDKVAAIILDLRSNGGGLLDEAVAVASIFIPEGVIVTTEGLHSPKEVYKASGGAYTDVPLYLLIDSYTASASEIVSGALQDDGRATLLGETTFGKGLVQSVKPLSNGGAVKVTTAVYLTPKGRDINETGISPDIKAPDDPGTTEVDECVQAALNLISDAGSAGR